MHSHKELESLVSVDMDAGEVFSGKRSGTTVKGYAKATSSTPAVHPEFIYHDAMRDIVVWFMSPPEPLYVFGPTGSGKTSLIRQLAAKLHYPVFEVTGHSRLEFPELLGHLSLDNGSMRYEYGPLALAMKYGGLVLINELDLLDPATAAGLNSVLDGSPLCISDNGGEMIIPHPMFRFVATANTNGGADETGLYQGTLRQNIAFMDRFWLCELGYPPADAELSLLQKVAPRLPETIRSAMVDFAGEVRKLFMGNGENSEHSIELTFSTRALIRWAELTVKFQPLARQGIQPVSYALDRALGYRAMPETRVMLHELAQRIFPGEGQNEGV